MKMLKYIQTWLLIMLLALSASGVANAKIASGHQILGADLQQSQTVLIALLHQGLEQVSTTDTSESPLATKGGGLGGNPFKGKTPEQIEKAFKDKGFDSRGTDPVNGLGGFVNPKTKRSFHIDPGREFKKGTEFPHVDVNRAKGSKLPKKKFPLGDRLNSNE